MMVALDELPTAKDVQTIALMERIEGLEGHIDRQAQTISDLQKSFLSKIEKITHDIADIREYFPKLVAEDRQRLTKLEMVKPQPHQIDKGAILTGLLTTHNGKMSSQEVREIMGISKQTLSNLLEVLPEVESMPMKTDGRKRLLVLKK
ncbi:MAG: hypothetical protein ACYDHX_07885 [Methanothrix sp.]